MVTSPRSVQGKQRKQQLVDVARQMFTQHGYTNTRIVDICDAAGVAKGLFHWYFSSKESLFLEILRDLRRQLVQAIDESTDPNADPITRMCQDAEASLRFMAINSALFAAVDTRRSEPSFLEEISAWEAQSDATYAALFIEAQAVGQIPGGDPALLAIGARNILSGFVHTMRARPKRFDDEDLVSFALELLRAVAYRQGVGVANLDSQVP